MNTCPTGFFCLDNNILIIVIIAIVYFIITHNKTKKKLDKHNKEKEIVKSSHQDIIRHIDNNAGVIINNPSIVETSLDLQRITNPLLPPLRSYPYYGGVAINIPTRGYATNYSQVGALICNDIKHGDTAARILPLFGRQTYPSSIKWQYYTIMDKYNMVKLPIISKTRQCLDDIGCDELYDGDPVTIPGNTAEFQAKIYKTDYPTYIQ